MKEILPGEILKGKRRITTDTALRYLAMFSNNDPQSPTPVIHQCFSLGDKIKFFHYN